MELEVRLRELGKQIDLGQQLKALVESKGWVNVALPLLDKMIGDVCGTYVEGRWHNGHLDDKRLGEEKLKSLMAYKRALVDYHNYIYEHVDGLESIMKEYNELVAEHQDPDYTQPMQDTEYKDD